jgi:hypothetical protein
MMPRPSHDPDGAVPRYRYRPTPADEGLDERGKRPVPSNCGALRWRARRRPRRGFASLRARSETVGEKVSLRDTNSPRLVERWFSRRRALSSGTGRPFSCEAEAPPDAIGITSERVPVASRGSGSRRAAARSDGRELPRWPSLSPVLGMSAGPQVLTILLPTCPSATTSPLETKSPGERSSCARGRRCLPVAVVAPTDGGLVAAQPTRMGAANVEVCKRACRRRGLPGMVEAPAYGGAIAP